MEKTYTLPDGTKFIFEYDHNRMGIITLECMDTLMSLLKATAEQTEQQTEPNLILPERMERGERYEVGETIVVMNRDDYYDLLCKSWKDESHTDTHNEAIKAMATLIKAKDEPQTDCSWK